MSIVAGKSVGDRMMVSLIELRHAGASRAKPH